MLSVVFSIPSKKFPLNRLSHPITNCSSIKFLYLPMYFIPLILNIVLVMYSPIKYALILLAVCHIILCWLCFAIHSITTTLVIMVWLVKHIVVVIIICFIIISSSSSMLAARSKLSEAGDTKKILQNATILSKTQQKGKSTVHQH